MTQILIDLWSDSVEIQPKFSSDWRNFQMIIFHNLTYHGEVTISGRRIRVFRRGTKYPKEKKRYIWLSEDRKSFWADPIQNSENLNITGTLETWPNDFPTHEGILKMSPGSVITCQFALGISTENIEPFGFDGLHRLHNKLQKCHRGYINLATGKPASDKYNFHR